MERVKLIVTGAVCVAVLAAGTWFWFSGVERNVRLRPEDKRLVTRGHKLYTAQCASCHGSDMEGQANWRERLSNGRLPAPPHDKSGHTWHHPDAQLFDLTKRGPAAVVGGDYQSDMPAYADVLSDEDIVAVLSYIKSTWPADIRARHDSINARSENQ
jgi:mono/diheme cytochrome c family protein